MWAYRDFESMERVQLLLFIGNVSQTHLNYEFFWILPMDKHNNITFS